MITLPTAPSEPTRTAPRNMAIYSKPKVGKTSALLQLPNSLLIDLERGSGSYKGMKIDVKSEAEIQGMTPTLYLYHLADTIKKAGKPYTFLIVDTVTELENLCKDYALQLYQATPMGGKFTGDVLSLPNGAGYQYLRTAFFTILSWFDACAEHVIYVGHVKDSLINKDSKEVSSKALDLTGKIKNMLAQNVDAIGIMYREGKNTNILSFETSEEVECGSRFDHLSGQKIVISEKTEKGLVTNWDKVFTLN